MNTKDDVIRGIGELLGNAGSAELAERVYERLRKADRLVYDERNGIALPEDVDVLAEAAAVLNACPEVRLGFDRAARPGA